MRKTIHCVSDDGADRVRWPRKPLPRQTSSEVWKSFAEQVEVGTELNVRLNDGHHFKATLVGVRDNAMLMQPRDSCPGSDPGSAV